MHCTPAVMFYKFNEDQAGCISNVACCIEWKLQFLSWSPHEITLQCAETKHGLLRLDPLLTMLK